MNLGKVTGRRKVLWGLRLEGANALEEVEVEGYEILAVNFTARTGLHGHFQVYVGDGFWRILYT